VLQRRLYEGGIKFFIILLPGEVEGLKLRKKTFLPGLGPWKGVPTLEVCPRIFGTQLWSSLLLERGIAWV